ncbi:MAG: class I SAM-dependent methyltransferase [Polyangiaceae bacterium]|nr:class I SAM-dependent methyltransferase [Polyangiaceae bacterium]
MSASSPLGRGIELAERGVLPDLAVRVGIRRLLAERLRAEARGSPDDQEERKQALLADAARSPIAVAQAAANAQHYEVPPEFFRVVLGPRLKYSAAYFPPGVRTLADAEEAMLALSTERALIQDGMRVLELGCGWGSLSLYLLERFRSLRVTAVSNSAPQRLAIEQRARQLGVSDRLEVLTRDVTDFEPQARFDRVVSVEMLEHVRNHAELLQRIAGWLASDGRLFVHVFCHRSFAYPFESEGEDNWMGQHFFTGGMMPSFDYLALQQRDLVLERRWAVGGEHYARTARWWLANLDAKRVAAARALGLALPPREVERALGRWRIFFLACEELFGHRGGSEWHVGHYRFAPRGER